MVMGLFCLLIPLLYRTPRVAASAAPVTTSFGFTWLFWVLVVVGFLFTVVLWGRKSLQNTVVSVSFWLLVALGAAWIAPESIPFFQGVFQPNPEVALLILGIAILLLCAIYLSVSGKWSLRTAAVLLIAFGFLIRLCYVLYTPVYMRQHDVFSFSAGDFSTFTYQRHGEYIEYIATYLRLPQVNPTEIGLSQLYHPPFHHLLAGLWLRLNTAIGEFYPSACENIQYLTLFYSSTCMVIAYRLFRLLGCKSWCLLVPLGVVCLHPTLILMAGSVNNDLLSITLAFYAIYAAVRWYQKPSLYHVFTVALGIGLSMMTKLSGGLIAVGIGCLFIIKWMQAIFVKQGKTIFWQLALFAVVCVPLALWWQVKNAVVYQIPLTYVPALSRYSGQYLGEYSIFDRLLGFEQGFYRDLFVAWKNQGQHTSYNEYNMFLALAKTSVFGEFTLFTQEGMGNWYSVAMIAGYGLTLFNLAAIGLSLYAGIRCMIRYSKSPITWCLVLIWAVVMFSYIQFCFAYPQTCTQNFRYAVPTLLCCLCGLGAWLKSSSKCFRALSILTVGGFMMTSFAVYSLLLLG